MAEWDVFDEAIINAKPDVVYKALVVEYSGKTDWWKSRVESKLREGRAVDRPGALLDITVHGGMSIKFTTKTVEVKKNELWRSEYVEGHFRGEGVWKLEAVDRNTRLSYHWSCRPSGLLMRILGPLVNIPKGHSEVVKVGFAALSEYLKKKAPAKTKSKSKSKSKSK